MPFSKCQTPPELPSQRDPRDRHRHVNPSCSRQHPRPLGQPRAVNNYVVVNSRFRKSSFEIDLDLILNAAEHSQRILELAYKGIRDAKELADLIGLTLSAKSANVDIKNLIGLVKILRGRIPSILQTDDQQNTVRINVDGDQYNVYADVVKLYQSKQVMEALTETVKPVTAEGIHKMEFLEDSNPVQEVAAEEAPYFGAGKNPTEVEELIAPYERTIVVQIVKPSFDPHLRWSVGQVLIFLSNLRMVPRARLSCWFLRRAFGEELVSKFLDSPDCENIHPYAAPFTRCGQQDCEREFYRGLLLFITLNREDFSFVIHLDRQPRTSRRREAQTGSRARSGSRSERTLDAVEHSRTLMEWWPFLIFHRGGLRIKVINNTCSVKK